MPHENVFNIGTNINELTGENSRFPGPVMPQLTLPRNALSLLGSFLYNFQFQLSRSVPFMARTGELMQRESLINTAEERAEVQNMARRMGNILHEISAITSQVAGYYQNLVIGDAPGSFTIVERHVSVETHVVHPNNLQNANSTQPPQNNQQNPQPQQEFLTMTMREIMNQNYSNTMDGDILH